MDYRPVNTHTERRGSRVRLYSQPKFVRPDGVTWMPIEDVVSVERDEATGAYRVMCGDEWITFTPRVRRGQLAQSVVSKTHFGDVLTPDSGYDGVVEYDIAYSSRVSPTPSGWQFIDITDVPLGVFLSDWRSHFGDRVSIRSDRASVDLTGVKADAFGQINLDPETVEVSEHASSGNGQETTWPEILAGTPDLHIMDDMIVGVQAPATNTFLCVRGASRFDTSAYQRVLQAHLWFTPALFFPGPLLIPANMVHVCRPTISSYEGGLGTDTVYVEVRAGYQTNPWGTMSEDDGEYVYDLTDKYEQTATFDIGVAHNEYDVNGTVPALQDNFVVQSVNARLELMLPGDGLALTGAGK